MIDYKNRSLKKELLDQNDIPFEDIALNMKELNFINSVLGGHSITIKGFKDLLQGKKKISVCEIGCGGGDNMEVIYKFCKRNNIISSFTGIDINNECIAFAKGKSKIENVNFIVSDYLNVDFGTTKPDIIFSSLFCHHFNDSEIITMLKWMDANSNIGFFINDLHRHPLAYHFIKLTTQLFSKSYLVKKDAPLSVLRGFKKQDWENTLRKSDLTDYTVKWQWAFRYLITV